MKKLLGIIVLAAIGFLVYQFFFSGTGDREGKVSTTICQIKEKPRRYAQFKKVTVEGTVAGSKSLASFNLIELKQQEKDCTIDVVAEGASPSKGKNITVKGLVKEAYKIGDNRKLVIVAE